jgi:hypothetical protein
MIRKLAIAAAIWLGCASANAQPLETSGAFLTPGIAYRTDCIKLYDNAPTDGRYLYASDGWTSNNYFTRLDLLTGTCAKAAALPAMEFAPQAFSGDYLIAEDGHYSRYSVYAKTDWKRHGTLRLNDHVAASAIYGDKLYLVQAADSTGDAMSHMTMTTLSLPDFTARKTVSLDMSGYNWYQAFPVANGFVLYYDKDLAVYDARTGQVRHKEVTMTSEGETLHADGYRQKVICPDDVRPVDNDTILVGQGCHSYALYDLASLTPRYSVHLSDSSVFAQAFHVGRFLFVFEGIMPDQAFAGQTYRIQILDYKSGAPVAAPSLLLFKGDTRLYQIGDNLVCSTSSLAGTGIDVKVYKMRETP